MTCGVAVLLSSSALERGARGAARTAAVRVMVRFYGDLDADDGTGVELEELTALLAEGRAWLLDNEQGRHPE